MDSTPSEKPTFQIQRKHLIWAVLGLFLCLGLVDWWLTRQREKRYDTDIVRVGRHYGVDPALIKAVVWRESRFNPKVRGRVGELGLMQIRPLVAEEWAHAQRKGNTFDGNLFEPNTNLEVGSWYLAKLLRRYAATDNPPAYALADYNAGRSNVLRWNKGPAGTNSSQFVEQITFPGTQEYVRAILRRRERYAYLGAEKPL